jgi:hypothetical protein
MKWRVLAQDENSLHPVFEAEDVGRFDELVVDSWFHMEWMDDNTWWLRAGDVVLWATVDRRGRATVRTWRNRLREGECGRVTRPRSRKTTRKKVPSSR